MRTATSHVARPAKVVVGIDGSEQGERAALWAAAQADAGRLPLCILYAADLDRVARFASFETVEGLREAGRELLLETEAAVLNRFPSLDVTRRLSRKRPVSALHDEAGPHDSIVVGSRGRGGFSALMLGSVSLGVTAGATVPVVVVRGNSEWSRTKRVTAAVRGTTDRDWMDHAARQAQLQGADLKLVGVRDILARAIGTARSPDEPPSLLLEEQSLTELAVALELAFPGTKVTAEVVACRSAAGVLVDASRHCDLMVMGGQRHLYSPRPSPGRVAHALLHHSHCPVQIWPRRRAEEDV
ncbi:universal stress protein [Streptomyces sp. NBC_01341]|uniref:universal stress protein n=1 Tax=Streptomyces sp. NBC_01341 TaxID=2903831 RepID=UPI002E157F69|nr:universal stress protein [Streptomyces sp. NBC_01341]